MEPGRSGDRADGLGVRIFAWGPGAVLASIPLGLVAGLLDLTWLRWIGGVLTVIGVGTAAVGVRTLRGDGLDPATIRTIPVNPVEGERP
jgi:hypothetical protein